MTNSSCSAIPHPCSIPRTEKDFHRKFSWNDGGQEGSPWTNDEAAHLLRELDNALTERGLSTDILPGEAAEWTYLYTTKDDPNRSKVIEAFFEPSSSAYIGDLTHVKNLIGGHSYWTDGTWDGMRNARERMAQTAGQYGLEVWQTEWSMLGDNYSSTEFGSYDTATISRNGDKKTVSCLFH